MQSGQTDCFVRNCSLFFLSYLPYVVFDFQGEVSIKKLQMCLVKKSLKYVIASKGAGGTGAAGAAAPVSLIMRGQHGGRKCSFLKPFSYTSEILSY